MKKIIFDLDNTLLYLSDEWQKYYQRVIDKYNLNISVLDLYNAIDKFDKTHKNIIVTRALFCKFLNEKLNINNMEYILEDLLKEYSNVPLLKLDEVYEVLEYLCSKYELIAYSNWFTSNQIERLKKNKLDKFFKKIYGWDEIIMKPSSRSINEIIGCDEIKEYIYVGDNIKYDIEVPNSMGMKTILLNRKGIKQYKYKEIYNIKDLMKIL